MLTIKNYIKPVLSVIMLCGITTQLDAAWGDYFAYLNPVKAYTAASQYVASRNLKSVLTTIEYQIEYQGKSTPEQWNQVIQLINSGADINTVTPGLLNSALHLAASDGDQDTIRNLDVINFLITKGIDQSLRNIKNSTFQDLRGSLTNNLKMVLTAIEDQYQGTEKQWNQVKQLINSGANINTVTYTLRNSALHLAASDPDKATIQKLDIINFLIAKGIDQSLKNKAKHTFKYIEECTQKISTTPSRIEEPSVEIRTVSVEALNKQLEQQLNYLIASDQSGWNRILQLIKQGANINTRRSNGDTALHMAVRENNLGKVHALLGYRNINIGLRNNNNETPLDIAKRLENQNIIKLLEDHGTVSVINKPYRSTEACWY